MSRAKRLLTNLLNQLEKNMMNQRPWKMELDTYDVEPLGYVTFLIVPPHPTMVQSIECSPKYAQFVILDISIDKLSQVLTASEIPTSAFAVGVDVTFDICQAQSTIRIALRNDSTKEKQRMKLTLYGKQAIA